MERDEEWNTEKKDISDFNSHAHVERDGLEKPLGVWDFDFNSHAHVERDFHFLRTEYQSKISTHTLTWSVT